MDDGKETYLLIQTFQFLTMIDCEDLQFVEFDQPPGRTCATRQIKINVLRNLIP